jgi:hypothetical protein
MSDHGPEQSVAGAFWSPARVAKLLVPFRAQLPPIVAWVLAGMLALPIGVHVYNCEDSSTILFTSAVTLTIGALLLMVTRRVLLTAVLDASLVAIIETVASLKQQTTELPLHSYEVMSLMGSWSAAVQFWTEHRSDAQTLLAALAATALVGLIAWHIDASRVRRWHAGVAALVFAGLAVIGTAAKGERRHTEFYFESVSLSFFYASWVETIEALWRGHLIEASAHSKQPALTLSASCMPAHKPPHIILIHQESVVPPAYFPALDYDRRIDRLFQSSDGAMHKLRVETFGGASWLTEFSLLTGLSSQSFGGMQQFVQPFMAGKLRDTLPLALARCGYRNIMIYPMLRNFLNSGKFFDRAGFKEIRDARDQGAKLTNERDRFYYTNALAEMEQHFKSSTSPLFLFVQTMATHGGYDYAYMPEVDVPGGGPGTHPEMHEYLRRLGMARMDYAFLRNELIRRFPRQEFLIVHYGDHQPTAALRLHGFGENATVEQVMRSGNTSALITYYALDAVRYRLPPLAAIDSIDIPYLGTVILEAAGLPLPDSHRERKRLMLLCGGRYHDCPVREEILRFHRRLIDAGLVGAK